MWLLFLLISLHYFSQLSESSFYCFAIFGILTYIVGLLLRLLDCALVFVLQWC